MRLHEMPAEQLIDLLEQRQEQAIQMEAEEARAKAAFESTQGTLLTQERAKGIPVEIAKKIIQGLPIYQKALEDYLKARIAYESARAAQHRAA